MDENNAPQNQQDDELSVEELEGAAGGVTNNCPNTNCPCNSGEAFDKAIEG